jgi:hypothetical protein
MGKRHPLDFGGGRSDVRAISAAFDALDVARHVTEYVAVDHAGRLYQGFVVVRSECREAIFHVDCEDAGNQAFTLLTPIGQPTPGFGLVFKILTGETRSYDYREGRALIFGDQFVRSTAPGRSETPTALLSFTFGTDRMADWPAIGKTAGFRGGLVRRPDGVLE